MRSFRQEWIAGAFVQPADGGTNSLRAADFSGNVTMRAANTFSDATVNSITGAAGWRGIATMNSGTSVVSVAATAAQSGAVIIAQPLQYTSDTSSQAFKSVAVQSVRAGAFEIVAVSSMAPVANMPIAWAVIR